MKQEQIHRLSEFLYTAGGSHRNSICIDCGECSHGCCTPGILLTTDYNGIPLLIPVSAFEELTGMSVDKTECLSVIGRRVFEEFYSRWLKWVADSAKDCQMPVLRCSSNTTTGINRTWG